MISDKLEWCPPFSAIQQGLAPSFLNLD